MLGQINPNQGIVERALEAEKLEEEEAEIATLRGQSEKVALQRSCSTRRQI